MRVVRRTGRICNLILTVLLVIFLSVNLYIIFSRLVTGNKQPTVFGYSAAVVMSGSMSGTIEVNDLVINRKEDVYEVGDVVTFDDGSALVTHRIVEKTKDGYITKGDANNGADGETITAEYIVGRVILVIPGIGLLIAYLKTTPGLVCLLIIGFLLIAMPILFRGSKNGKANKEENNDEN